MYFTSGLGTLEYLIRIQQPQHSMKNSFMGVGQWCDNAVCIFLSTDWIEKIARPCQVQVTCSRRRMRSFFLRREAVLPVLD